MGMHSSAYSTFWTCIFLHGWSIIPFLFLAAGEKKTLFHLNTNPFLHFKISSFMSLLRSPHSLHPYRSLSFPSSFLISRHKNYQHFDMGLLSAVFRFLDAIIGPACMLLFPLYASIRAIETPSTLDDQQWLTYWILYSLITLFELSCWQVLHWLPFWPYMKLLFCIWLVLPIFNGAAYIYENFVRKYAKVGGTVSSSFTEGQRKVLLMMTPDARRSVEQYISKYGAEAFERVVKAAEKEARKR